jgi:hypothetical protein
MSVAEQRYKAVLAAIADGRTVTEVARDWGWHGKQQGDAVYVASNPRWGACTQAGQTVQCAAIATVMNQGGSRIARVQYLAFHLPNGTGCDADIPAIDPGASTTLSCVVTMGSNFPPGTTRNQAPTDPPKAIV